MNFLQVKNKNMYVSSCGCFLKSYNKIIIAKKGGEIYINADYHDYSVTTARHRNLYLGVDSKEFKKNVKKGKYNFITNDEIMEMYKAYIS